MIRKTKCHECDDIVNNCVEVGMDGNWVCIGCLKFILDLYNTKMAFQAPAAKGCEQRTEKIDPDNIDF